MSDGMIVVKKEPGKEPAIQMLFGMPTRWRVLRHLCPIIDRAGYALTRLGHMEAYAPIVLLKRNTSREEDIQRMIRRQEVAELEISRVLFDLALGDGLFEWRENKGEAPTSHAVLSLWVGSVSLNSMGGYYTNDAASDDCWWREKVRKERCPFPDGIESYRLIARRIEARLEAIKEESCQRSKKK